MLVSHPEQLAHKLGAVAKVLLDQLAANLATETWSNLGLSLCYKKNQLLIECSPVSLTKAVKNEVEIQGFVNCHIRDAAALCSYFAWLEKEVASGNVSEISGAEKIASLRGEMENFVGLMKLSENENYRILGIVLNYRCILFILAAIKKNNEILPFQTKYSIQITC